METFLYNTARIAHLSGKLLNPLPPDPGFCKKLSRPSRSQMSINNDLVKALAAVLPGKIAVAGGETYAASNDSYFSAFEADITPSCIAQPTSAEDVAKLVKALRPALANGRRGVAAIRGGGNVSNFSSSFPLDGHVWSFGLSSHQPTPSLV